MLVNVTGGFYQKEVIEKFNIVSSREYDARELTSFEELPARSEVGDRGRAMAHLMMAELAVISYRLKAKPHAIIVDTNRIPSVFVNGLIGDLLEQGAKVALPVYRSMEYGPSDLIGFVIVGLDEEGELNYHHYEGKVVEPEPAEV